MKSAIEHLENLIRIPSVSDLSNRQVIDYAVEALHHAQWRTRQMIYHDGAGVEKINLIAAPPGQDVQEPAAELAFFCHTDTVPYAPDWANATEPAVRDGMIFGCGACDVKGFLACLLTAAASVASPRFVDGLRLVLTAEEEIGCIGAGRLIASGAIRPRRVAVGEPTSLHVARAGKGYCLAEIAVFGQEAHSALPQQGKSAIYSAARLIAAIEEFGQELAKEQNDFFNPGFTTLNVGTIQGGAAKNVVAGQCGFPLEWRPIPGQAADTVPASLARIIQKLRVVDPGFHAEVRMARQQGGFETPAGSGLVRTMETLSGREAVSIAFGSEASLLSEVAEEVVVFGPGDMGTAHSSRECVPIREIDEAGSILKTLMSD
ncbi:MAG: acetylornithine deacetylase [Acidobacteriaceae bacterium]